MSPTTGGRRSMLRRLALGGIGAGISIAITMTTAVDASAAPQSRKPTRAAASVGVTAEGGGYAGWSAKYHAGHTKSPRKIERPYPGTKATARVYGIDVASYQGNVNWASWWSQGKRFAYVKATEGNSYKNPYFSQQYTGSYKVGMIRGAYHFARPDGASGAAQARYFVANGGGWTRDGKTLPGALDIEDNYTGGGRCWGNTDAENRAWIRSFVAEYKRLTGRDVVIYTNRAFWGDCVYTQGFKTTNPLWIAYWSKSEPSWLPGGWPYWTFWQYSGTGTDLNAFSAGMVRLKALATG
jgi:GH25 family lysozyme M1 (1,4-beta-N-acetylmuramidase)